MHHSKSFTVLSILYCTAFNHKSTRVESNIEFSKCPHKTSLWKKCQGREECSKERLAFHSNAKLP